MTPQETPIGDQNIERLVGVAYKPEAPDASFVQNVEEHLCFVAHQLASARKERNMISPVSRLWQQRAAWITGLAACLAIFSLVWYARSRPYTPGRNDDPRVEAPIKAVAKNGKEKSLPVGMTARPRAGAPSAKPLAVGDALITKAGERRRIALVDGSILFVNQNSQLTQTASREIEMTRGEVYLEVAPRENPEGPSFVVKTPKGQVSAFGTRFVVRTNTQGTGVLVTQGKVQVNNQTVEAGQEVAPGTQNVAPAPRASHVLDWTRDLVAAAESPLVPANKHAGGALVAVDPNGQEVQLSLRKFLVDVHIEDGFARTTIDQTYFNNLGWRLEGTFYFPLPPDAVLSRLAMYVEENGEWCKIMEGGMAEREHARTVFETIRYTNRDPALLEWVDGSTFRMRVFPLEGRKEKRIILSYTQRLNSLYGVTSYRFPGGLNMENVAHWQFQGRVKNAADMRITAPTHPTMQVKDDGNDKLLLAVAHDIKPDRDVWLEMTEANAARVQRPETARFSRFEQDGFEYLMVRYRLVLPGKAQSERRDWVFLYESAANRDPLLARAQIEIMRTMLENANHGDTLTLLAASTRVQMLPQAARPVNPQNIAEAVRFLENTHLIGALDLEKAIQTVLPHLKEAKNPHFVHLGAGVAAIGERREDALAKMIPENVRYIGVGVGKRWSRAFMKMAADRTGGYFTQINPDESINWRAFELLSTLNTPRLLDVRVIDNAEKASFLTETVSLAQGEELCAITRVKKGNALPRSVSISGRLDGRPFAEQLEVKEVADNAAYLPRQWAKHEIDRLLAQDAEKNKNTIIELSKAMYVMSPYTSLLVLETEADYKRFNVDRGRKDHWALYPTEARIKNVYEPDPNWVRPPVQVDKGEKKPVEEVLNTLLVRIPPQIWTSSNNPHRGLPVAVSALYLYNGAFAMSFGDTDELSQMWFFNNEVEFESLARDNFDRSRGLNRAHRLGEMRELAQGLLRRQALTENAAREILTDSEQRLGLLRLEPASRAAGKSAFRRILTPRFEPATGQSAPWGGTGFGGRAGQSFGGGIGGFGGGIGGFGGFAGGFGQPLGDFANLNQPVGGGFGLPASGPVPSSTGPMFLSKLLRTELKDLIPMDELAEVSKKRSKESFMAGLTHRLLQGRQRGSVLYDRPVFSGEHRVFNDLLMYAPGLHNTSSDIEGTLDKEAKIANRPASGKIDAAAKALVDKARSDDWFTITFPASGKQIEWKLFANGAGHFAYERTLPSGLKEQVICNDDTMLHLYPDLGLAGRRSVSRFHRAGFSNLVPWYLPPIEDLAIGADVRAVDAVTVAIVPQAMPQTKEREKTYELHLVFGKDGKLAERQSVEMPSGKVIYRETYEANGTVHIVQGEDKQEIKLTVSPAEAPDLRPDTKQLVVLSLPIRTREYEYAHLKNWNGGDYSTISEEQAIALIASESMQQVGHALQVFGERFHAKGDRRIGFYVLLSTSHARIQPKQVYHWNKVKVKFDIVAEHPNDPLAKYLAHANTAAYQGYRAELGELPGPKDGFIQQLSTFRDLHFRWTQGRANQGTQEQRTAAYKEALDFIKTTTVPHYAWIMLDVLQRYGGIPNALEFHEAARRVYGEEPSGMTYAARYELARTQLNAGQQDAARKAFAELYADARKSGGLPLIDQAFRQALQQNNQYGDLMRRTAGELLDAKRPEAVLLLSWQLWQLGDHPFADEIYNLALGGANIEDHDLRLVALEYLCETQQWPRADGLLQQLLADEKLATRATIWRLGAAINQRRGMLARSVACLEKAMDLEYQNLPDAINLQVVRNDYQGLMTHYQQLALAVTMLDAEPPQEFLAKVVRAADRWRSLDPEATAACQLAAKSLQALGAKELAWDYLTTPIGMKPNEAAPWHNLAQTLRGEGELLLADRAFDNAYKSEPTNAQILWERAQNLQQAGKTHEARQLYQELANRTWQPRFQWIQQQARTFLNRN